MAMASGRGIQRLSCRMTGYIAYASSAANTSVSSAPAMCAASHTTNARMTSQPMIASAMSRRRAQLGSESVLPNRVRGREVRSGMVRTPPSWTGWCLGPGVFATLAPVELYSVLAVYLARNRRIGGRKLVRLLVLARSVPHAAVFRPFTRAAGAPALRTLPARSRSRVSFRTRRMHDSAWHLRKAFDGSRRHGTRSGGAWPGWRHAAHDASENPEQGAVQLRAAYPRHHLARRQDAGHRPRSERGWPRPAYRRHWQPRAGRSRAGATMECRQSQAAAGNHRERRAVQHALRAPAARLTRF